MIKDILDEILFFAFDYIFPVLAILCLFIMVIGTILGLAIVIGMLF